MATTTQPETRPHEPPPPNRQPQGEGGPPAPPPAAPQKPARRGRVFLIMGIILLVLVGFGARRWWFGRTHVTTDDAQVDGHIVPILPKVGAFVSTVRVIENQPVKAGDTLVVLDDRDFRARLEQADADLA